MLLHHREASYRFKINLELFYEGKYLMFSSYSSWAKQSYVFMKYL